MTQQHRAEGLPDANGISEATRITWRSVEDTLVPVFGVPSLDVLFRRALKQTTFAFPWLAAAVDRGGSARPLPNLMAFLASGDAAAGAEAASALLSNFVESLSSLLGESFTTRLLAPLWEQPPLPSKPETASGNSISRGVQSSSDSSGSFYASLLQALIETVSRPGSAASNGTASAAAAATVGPPATAASIAIQGLDVQAFLHHLFGALRQAGAPSRGGFQSKGTPAPAVTPAPEFAAAIEAARFASTRTKTWVAVSPELTAAGSDPASPYRHQDVVSALQYLVTNLETGQEVQGVCGSGLFTGTIENLNTSFTKLIGDLNGTGEAGSSTDPRTAATSTSPGTAALQSFLSTFLQQLKLNQVRAAANALGGTVNATV
jgi:hypothetical protein